MLRTGINHLGGNIMNTAQLKPFCKEVRREDAHGDTPSLNRLEYLSQFASHVQDCFCKFSGHNCRFVFRAPRAPVRAPGAIEFNVLVLN